MERGELLAKYARARNTAAFFAGGAAINGVLLAENIEDPSIFIGIIFGGNVAYSVASALNAANYSRQLAALPQPEI